MLRRLLRQLLFSLLANARLVGHWHWLTKTFPLAASVIRPLAYRLMSPGNKQAPYAGHSNRTAIPVSQGPAACENSSAKFSHFEAIRMINATRNWDNATNAFALCHLLKQSLESHQGFVPDGALWTFSLLATGLQLSAAIQEAQDVPVDPEQIKIGLFLYLLRRAPSSEWIETVSQQKPIDVAASLIQSTEYLLQGRRNVV